MSDLTELLERVRQADGPDRELDEAIVGAFNLAEFRMYELESGAERYSAPNITASIDAALALVERALPGWTHGYQKFPDDEVFNPGGYQFFVSEEMNPVEGGYASGESVSLPLAILAALLQAKLAQEPEQ